MLSIAIPFFVSILKISFTDFKTYISSDDMSITPIADGSF